MKTKAYIRLLFAAAVTLGAAGCDENSWNDNLDGFDEIDDAPITDVQSVEYTLTDEDYAAIASNSTNNSLAGDEGKDALKAVGTKKMFSADAPAAKYVPAYLTSTAFPYFTLNQGSAVKLTFNQALPVSETVEAASAPQTLTVSDDYYQYVWDSDENFINAFAPSKPAADYLPEFLSDEADANDGLYAIVQYKVAAQDPVFGGGEPAGPVEIFSQTFTEDLGAFTIEDKVIPADLSFVWSWGGANYGAKASAYLNGVSYATESWLVSPEIDLTGMSQTVMTFEHVVNKFPDAEFAKANCTLWGRKSGGNWQQITIPQYTGNDGWTFGESGEISLAAFEGSKMQFAFKYVSEDGKSGTWEVKNLVINGMPASASAPARAASVETVTMNAVYFYDGSKWTVPANFVVLQPADYATMGQRYPNLSKAEPFLSTYLNVNYPYAADGDVKYIMWQLYASGSTTYQCSEYVRADGQWSTAPTSETVTEQFVNTANGWVYNPDVTIVLPAGKNQPLSTKYFQACVDWVFENICKPLGDTNIKSGLYYISSYGNNEYYSGTSAYQGNVDLRPSAARAQYPAEYESMSDEAIVELEKSRFMNEVMPGALAMLHPDARPVEGLEVHYTITFGVYNGTSTDTYTAVFVVTGPGKFEPVSCTWDAAE